jgi:hypothetical protein
MEKNDVNSEITIFPIYQSTSSKYTSKMSLGSNIINFKQKRKSFKGRIVKRRINQEDMRIFYFESDIKA